MERTGRLGFVTPRYGAEVVGGAEAVMRESARGLAERGWDVEVLTTCARDHYTWVNEYEPGLTSDGPLRLRRFPAVVDTSRAERAQIEAAVLAGERPPIEMQQRWVNDDLRVPELFHHLLDRAEDYRALIFAPYMFWPTFACAQIAPTRSILMPCLHDEPHAALEIYHPIFTGVRGLWFLSEPERRVAERLHARLAANEVVGSGIHVPESYDPGGFRGRYGIDGRFVLFAGRREGAKNWERLLAGFGRAIERGGIPFSLVTIGTGVVAAPDAIADRVLDLGFVSAHDRDGAFAAADAYLQPSPYESFSRTVMEAWLAGTLPIANGESDVVRWHFDRAGSGLVYDDDVELEQCLRFIGDAPDVAASLAAPGRQYVLENYTWPPVLDLMEATIEKWLPV